MSRSNLGLVFKERIQAIFLALIGVCIILTLARSLDVVLIVVFIVQVKTVFSSLKVHDVDSHMLDPFLCLVSCTRSPSSELV